MAKSFSIEQVQERAEQQTNKLLQRRHKPSFIYMETDPISSTLKGQFVKPGFIDHRYSLHVRESCETQDVAAWTEESSVRVTLTPPSQTQMPVNASWDMTVSPSHAPTRSPLGTATRQYLILLGVLLAEYRTTWFIHVLNGLLVPISFTFFVVAVGGVTSSERAIYLLGGNLALSIATGPTAFLITKLGWARQSQEFDYWLALPLSKLMMLFALISVALLFALPGLLGTYVFASLLFKLPFNASIWALIPLIPLGVLPLAGVGAMLGTMAPNGQVANILGNIVLLFVGILSPLMLPLEALPVPLRITSQFVPTTYVADAFRTVLKGDVGINLVVDIVILALFSAVLLTFTYFRLDWRNA